MDIKEIILCSNCREIVEINGLREDPIEAYQCGNCGEVYEDKEEAEDCCVNCLS